MGLKLIPETHKIFLYEKAGADLWGITTASDTKKEIKCLIREAQQKTPVNSIEGKQILITYVISFNGIFAGNVGDKIEVNGQLMEILTKNFSNDLSGNTLLTKITV